MPTHPVVLVEQALLAVERALHRGQVRDHRGITQAGSAQLEVVLDARDLRPGGVAQLDRRSRIGPDQLGQVGGGHPAPAHGRIGVWLVEAGEDA